MSGHHKRRRSGKGSEYKRGDKQHESADSNEAPDTSSPIIQAFLEFHKELDTRHDKHERLVKLSRDVTIESKRIIFMLQRTTGEPSSAILDQANEKLKTLQKTKFLDIAKELNNEDPFQFVRAYSPGLQEYIEAITFYFYLKEDRLVTLKEVQDDLNYPKVTNDSKEPKDTAMDVDQGTSEKPSADDEMIEASVADSTTDITDEMEKNLNCNENISVHIPYDEYMLGICDLTGELMRLAINSAGAGHTDLSFKVCSFFRRISEAFTAVGSLSRVVCRKMSTLRKCLQKVEDACYTLQVRGSEIPKHMLADILSSTTSDFVSFSEELVADD